MNAFGTRTTEGSLERVMAGSTPKTYRGGSARSVLPETTLSRIRPMFKGCGITRVANITGLDRVGIPVFQAIRPNARSLSTSQGKGADPMAARVSAAMEAIELFHAERPRCALRWANLSELKSEGPVADPERLPHTRDFDPERHLLWTRGYDLLSNAWTFVPFDLVHVNLTEPAGAMEVTSNGLASGNSLIEAIFHGLCEVIERDAEALFSLRSAEQQASALLDSANVPHAGVRALLGQLQAAELTPVAWDMTSDVGLPVVRVFLFDTQADPILNVVAAPYGAGCHIDPATALIRALTESAQTRVGWIAGSRDDLSRDHYRRAQANTDYLAELSRLPRSAGLGAWSAREGETIEDDVRVVLAALRRVGVERVIVVPLNEADAPVAIARVIVTDLEGPRGPDTVPGKRARRLAL